jgi:hypothetical protein
MKPDNMLLEECRGVSSGRHSCIAPVTSKMARRNGNVREEDRKVRGRVALRQQNAAPIHDPPADFTLPRLSFVGKKVRNGEDRASIFQFDSHPHLRSMGGGRGRFDDHSTHRLYTRMSKKCSM